MRWYSARNVITTDDKDTILVTNKFNSILYVIITCIMIIIDI